MKVAIVYNSMTGNTKKQAENIKKGVEKAVPPGSTVDIFPLKEVMPQSMRKYDLIGIGSYVCLTEPINVGKWVENMYGVGGKHFFTFSTHGTIREYFHPSLIAKVRAKGGVVIGYNDWYADCFIPWHPDPYPTGGHPDDIAQQEAVDFGEQMVLNSLKIKEGDFSVIPDDPPIPPPLPPKSDFPMGDTTDSPDNWEFHPELCNYAKGCSLCMDNCTMFMIDHSVDPPILPGPDCQPHCTMCIQVCPTGAIEMDAFIFENKDHYPITTRALALPRLDEEEKKGNFRRIVPWSDKNFDTMYYQVYSGHPKYIVGKGPVTPDGKIGPTIKRSWEK